jgi:pimeloyl-ACP methyl ester carboxylesterase
MSIDTWAQALALQGQASRHVTRIDADGALFWHCWGTLQQGQHPLVLLHGGSGSWNHWVRNINTLVAAGRQVWVPDLPGCGESAKPAEAEDADDLPAPVEQGLQALLGDAPIDLVGFSFGGMVAGFVARQWPARVARLVLVGAAGLGVQPAQPLVLKSWLLARSEAGRLQAHRHNLGALMLARPDSVDELALALHAANLPRDRLLRRRISRTDVLRRSLAGVACPVHAIYGERDVLFAPQYAAVAEALGEAPGFASLQWLPGAGHWVQYEAPEAFDRALAQALQGA